jgi:hypothetical protein
MRRGLFVNLVSYSKFSFQEHLMFRDKLRIPSRVIAACALALSMGACAVYEPAPAYPAYPSYGYAPGYYYAPPPATSFSFGYYSRPYRHHYHHWRG